MFYYPCSVNIFFLALDHTDFSTNVIEYMTGLREVGCTGLFVVNSFSSFCNGDQTQTCAFVTIVAADWLDGQGISKSSREWWRRR